MTIEEEGMKLKGKVALITGGGRGLGRAIAIEMAREGARIVVVARTQKEIEQTVSEIEATGGKAFAVPCDISSEEAVDAMISQIAPQVSALDILVNNAAIIGPPRFMDDADLDSWRQTIDVNLNGVYLCTRAVLPGMVNGGAGKIINISSGLGQMPFPRFCAYGVSKAGLIQMTRSLSEELKPYHIQINAIDPGVMDTSMQEGLRALGEEVLGEELHAQFLGFRERGLLKRVEAVAPLAVFLASPESNHLTGVHGTLEDYRRLGWKP
jgi:3-oxoacyl-[acyl-carrier protein] reductase